MTQVPSAAAKRKACELANALRGDGAWQPSFLLDAMTHPLYALALHLDEVDAAIRAGYSLKHDCVYMPYLLPFKLPDEPDVLEEVLTAAKNKYHTTTLTPQDPFALVRAELDKRGLTLTAKEG